VRPVRKLAWNWGSFVFGMRIGSLEERVLSARRRFSAGAANDFLQTFLLL